VAFLCPASKCNLFHSVQPVSHRSPANPRHALQNTDKQGIYSHSSLALGLPIEVVGEFEPPSMEGALVCFIASGRWLCF
jgi:hypothetical protein